MGKVIIIGGGIAGLAVAYQLEKLANTGVNVSAEKVNYILIESSPTLGGKIVSQVKDGFVIEGGPDSFLTQKPGALELCHELGLADQFIGANLEKQKIYVWSRGKLRAMPEGVMLMVPGKLWPFLKSDLISWTGKLRMAMEILIPRKQETGDESLGSFVRRRMGKEALAKIAGPIMGGIHAADVDRLSLLSTFPRFFEMEKKFGSLLRGMYAQRRVMKKTQGSAAPVPMFLTLCGGLGCLVDAMVTKLDPVCARLGQKVESIRKHQDMYEVELTDGTKVRGGAVVFATPAYVTAKLLERMDAPLASKLRSISYVSTATVSLGYKRSDIQHPLDGHGFVVAQDETRHINACSWSSTKFSGRAPEGHVLLRVFIGDAGTEYMAEQGVQGLIDLAREELNATMCITAEPVLTKAYRWFKASPQYNVGHAALVTEIETMMEQHEGFYVVGAAYHGSGLPDCIQSGKNVAQKVFTELQDKATRQMETLEVAS